MSSASKSSTDRAQVSGGPWRLGGFIFGVIVLAIVVDEARSQVAAVDGPVEYCGLCHVDWRLAATLLALGVSLSALTWAGLRYRPSL
jgi:hypothetical protein